MIRLYLEQNGIPAIVQGVLAGSALEWVPFVPLIDVSVEAVDVSRAAPLVAKYLDRLNDPGMSWVCDTCGETIEGSFDECWQCRIHVDSLQEYASENVEEYGSKRRAFGVLILGISCPFIALCVLMFASKADVPEIKGIADYVATAIGFVGLVSILAFAASCANTRRFGEEKVQQKVRGEMEGESPSNRRELTP